MIKGRFILKALLGLIFFIGNVASGQQYSMSFDANHEVTDFFAASENEKLINLAQHIAFKYRGGITSQDLTRLQRAYQAKIQSAITQKYELTHNYVQNDVTLRRIENLATQEAHARKVFSYLEKFNYQAKIFVSINEEEEARSRYSLLDTVQLIETLITISPDLFIDRVGTLVGSGGYSENISEILKSGSDLRNALQKFWAPVAENNDLSKTDLEGLYLLELAVLRTLEARRGAWPFVHKLDSVIKRLEVEPKVSFRLVNSCQGIFY